MCRSITSYNISCIKGFFLSGMKQALNTESAVMRYEKRTLFTNLKILNYFMENCVGLVVNVSVLSSNRTDHISKSYDSLIVKLDSCASILAKLYIE